MSRQKAQPRRRAFTAAAVAVLATVCVAVPAAAKPNNAGREVRGTIEVPTGTATTPAPGTTVAVRCLATATGGTRDSFTISGVVPGRVFSLMADAGPWRDDFDVAFHASPAGCAGTAPVPGLPHRSQPGDEHGVVPAGATLAVVTLAAGQPGAAFTYRELPHGKVKIPRPGDRRPTVVAVVELNSVLNQSTFNGLNPYVFDFLGHQYPWNTDEDPDNDLDFTADPSTYIPGHPGASPVQLTLPTAAEGDKPVDGLATGVDNDAWNGMRASTATTTNMYYLPGTKVVGAVRIGTSATGPGRFDAPANSHLTKVASVAVGNRHGTCAECVFVLVSVDSGFGPTAIEWVKNQRWIDVVTNSWISPTPGIYQHITKAATEHGQTVVWGAGNGVEFAAPLPTYQSAQSGPDWVVTVGGVSPLDDQPMNVGRPVDVAGYAAKYPSGGGSTAAGTTSFDGTSNATPVVAGTIAQVVQWGRDLLGDHTPGNAGGVVAQGEPVPCELATADCPLADGKLTRKEALDVVFRNVQPSFPRQPAQAPRPALPLSSPTLFQFLTTPGAASFTSQGHGIVHGRLDPARFEAERRRFLDVLRGVTPSFARPPGEWGWMTADSRCRQRLWGAWAEGYASGDAIPAFNPTTDQAGIGLYAACTAVPRNGLVPFILEIQLNP